MLSKCICGLNIILILFLDTVFFFFFFFFFFYLFIYFFLFFFFCNFNLVIFSSILAMKVNGQWIPCVHNSSYRFIPIPLNRDRCLDHALMMCMWFQYNPPNNFSIELSRFLGI